jgi:hypothetical protein
MALYNVPVTSQIVIEADDPDQARVIAADFFPLHEIGTPVEQVPEPLVNPATLTKE